MLHHCSSVVSIWTMICAMISETGFTTLALAALLTLSSFPRLCTNTDAGFPSWSTAECMVSPDGNVRSGSSRVQLRTALVSAPMAALAPLTGPTRVYTDVNTLRPYVDIKRLSIAT